MNLMNRYLQHQNKTFTKNIQIVILQCKVKKNNKSLIIKYLKHSL